MSVPFFVVAGDFEYASVLVGNGNASFAGVMQTFSGVVYTGMGAGQALADLGHITKAKMDCRDVLALMDHKSLVYGLEFVGSVPMSLLVYTPWTSPNVWTRQLHPDSTASLPLQCLLSPKNEGQNCREVKLQVEMPRPRFVAIDGPALNLRRLEAQPLQTCRAARRPTHGSPSITCSTVVPSRCQESRSPVHQQLSRSILKWGPPGIVMV